MPLCAPGRRSGSLAASSEGSAARSVRLARRNLRAFGRTGLHCLAVMIAPLGTDVAIETPEHIVFRYRLAGPARRALAYVIDLCACYGVVFLLGLIVVLAFVGDCRNLGATRVRWRPRGGGPRE